MIEAAVRSGPVRYATFHKGGLRDVSLVALGLGRGVDLCSLGGGKMDLIIFMEKKETEARQKGDMVRADKLRKIIREWKAMDREQQTLSSI